MALVDDLFALHAEVAGCDWVGADGVFFVESDFLGVPFCAVALWGVAAGVWDELAICDSDDDCHPVGVCVAVHVSVSV